MSVPSFFYRQDAKGAKKGKTFFCFEKSNLFPSWRSWRLGGEDLC